MTNGYSCPDEGAVYYQVLTSQGVPCYVQATETAVAVAGSTTTTTTSTVARATSAPNSLPGNSCTSTNSTSSMLCISSEMSIPMGRVNACEATTTTTTTTTHQYDDVACQQLGRRSSTQADQEEQQQQQQSQQQQMLQVRPRGIAYVIQFSVADGSSEKIPEMLSLQDQLQRARPQFCAKSKQRKAILNQMQMLRNLRRRELDEIIETASLEMLDRRLDELPPPATCKYTRHMHIAYI